MTIQFHDRYGSHCMLHYKMHVYIVGGSGGGIKALNEKKITHIKNVVVVID